ncbi:ATP-dependent RNA helicase [Scheffersomyces spartinae]|uniref:ATP-dependent RNA helicase n=1 Tax=Scheffersomyces spartinae TaxID=45513 RepID=A0A9P7VEA8_9ASCO|nr:ATP-dependent RNA helicase [Scheffersomyces spartinae]KAG7195863.1 ATP-dependent RNA helicase [Scheffersomyces spartinae]
MSHLVFQNLDANDDHDINDIHLVVTAQVADEVIELETDDFVPSDAIATTSLPDYACAYCGIHNVDSVVKCETCQKWFCNTKIHSNSSHIVTHMVMSRHTCVSLHPDSDLGDTTLECYNCGNKNAFILGFVSAKQDSVMVILCRLPCAQLKDINWDTTQWQALLDDRQFVSWVAGPPTEEELINARLITNKQITKLEAQWRLNRDATILDIEKNENEEEDVLPILMRYNDAFQYQRAFAPLIKLESDFDKNLKESQALEHILVSWALGLNKNHLASFTLSTYESNNLKIAVGDEIVLRCNNGTQDEAWSGRGYIIRLPSAYQEEFTLELISSATPPPTNLTTDFTAEFVWKGTSYERMQRALNKFAVDEESVSSYIYHKLLGHDVAPIEFDTRIPPQVALPLITELNQSQLNAVKLALQRPLSLIQGPPGTGKTVTSATILYHLSHLHKSTLLMCAPSNVAVDHLATKLHNLGLWVVRFTARSREDVESQAEHLSLHSQVERGSTGKLRKLFKLKKELGELSAADSKTLAKLSRIEERKILDKCHVVCTTCVGAGDKRLKHLKFRTVLIDESTQASEPEVLIPIVKGAKQVILVGDHQQLGPVVLNRKAGDAGLTQSLFERLVLLGHVPIRLEVQYRMHPCLSEFPSNMFYEGSLQNGVTKEHRLLKKSTFPWPVSDTPMMFWANYGREEISSSGYSYLNRVEAMNVERVVSKLFKDKVSPDQIGIITPYEGQRAYIVLYMAMNSSIPEFKDKYLQLEIASVDAFQGREKDFIILSCVRANDQQQVGFLSDPRRLNVALTRAKYGLIILGNPRALCRNALWNHVLLHFRERGCLVDGPLDNLQFSMVQLSNPKAKRADAVKKLQHIKDGGDTESLASFATVATETEWPKLGMEDTSNTYSKSNNLSSNFYSKLSNYRHDGVESRNERPQHHQSRKKVTDYDENMLNITNSFVSQFSLS